MSQTCSVCGAPVDAHLDKCPYCGASIPKEQVATEQPAQPQVIIQQVSQEHTPVAEEDKSNAGFNVLAFFVPLAGWILWGVWRKQYPKKAHGVAKWAWVGFALQVVYQVLMMSFILSNS